MSGFVDYYEVLQVHPKAEPEVIKRAYRVLIMENHPDRGGDEAVAKRLTAAYYVLQDEGRRAAYDRTYWEERQQPSPRVGSSPDLAGQRQANYLTPDDIDSAVLDAVMAAFWLAGVTATTRAVGRIAGEAARSVAQDAGKALLAGLAKADAFTGGPERRDRQLAVMMKQSQIRLDQRAMQTASTIEAMALGWTGPITHDALEAVGRVSWWQEVEPSPGRDEMAFYSGYFSHLPDDDLLWIGTRHPGVHIRTTSIMLVQHRHPRAKPYGMCRNCRTTVWLNEGGRCTCCGSEDSITQAWVGAPCSPQPKIVPVSLDSLQLELDAVRVVSRRGGTRGIQGLRDAELQQVLAWHPGSQVREAAREEYVRRFGQEPE